MSIVCENVREGNKTYEINLYPVGAIHELPLQFLKNYLPITISQNDNIDY